MARLPYCHACRTINEALLRGAEPFDLYHKIVVGIFHWHEHMAITRFANEYERQLRALWDRGDGKGAA